LQKILFKTLTGKLPTSKVYCPLSEREYYFFIQIKNDNVSPILGAKSRHRLLWLYLKNETELFNKQNDLLHVAPEYCLFQRLREMPNINYYPGDKFEKGYGVQRGVHQLDLTALNLVNDSFDYIICNHILEHIPDDLKAMTEMLRVLKKNGNVFIMVPINLSLTNTYEDFNIVSPEERTRHFGQWDHVRYYSMDIIDRLKSCGLKVTAIKYSEKFTEAEIRRLGLCEDYIFVARKD